MNETRFSKGMNVLKQIDGVHGEVVYESIKEVSPSIAELMVEIFGDIYTRPHLDFKEREIVSITSLLTLGGTEQQIKVHVNAALNVGMDPEKIVEICTHCIPYAGFPRVLNALFVVKEVLKERHILIDVEY